MPSGPVLRLVLAASLVSLVSAGSAVAAPILQVTSEGILTGATGVDVNGAFYDVVFSDGTCVTDFSGCDSAADFAFSTQGAAEAAATALLFQVFVDGAQGNFDTTHLNRIFGCGADDLCQSLIPFGVAGAVVGATYVDNLNEALSGQSDSLFSSTTDPTFPLSSFAAANWARFSPAAATPVPEPASMTLLGLGLAGIAARRWRQRRN